MSDDLVEAIAKWIEQLDESIEPNDRGIGHTTRYISMGRMSLANSIRVRAWEHTQRCMVNRSSDYGPCTCKDEEVTVSVGAGFGVYTPSRSYTVIGQISSFDPSTWWGEATYDLTVVNFHGTCVRGMTRHFNPTIGSRCKIIFNADHRLLSIELL